jgi:tartrate-resistant acid phosphatase type 5
MGKVFGLRCINRLVYFAFLTAFLTWLNIETARGDAPAQPPVAATENPLELFAVGDWGIDSPDRQKVADAMAKTVGAEHHPAAVLLLGDNYYIDLSDVTDPRIQTFFEKTYDPVKLNVPFYAVLGNHDYKGNNAAIELAYAAQGHTRFTMPSRWYRLDLPAGHPVATILMLDSNKDTMAPSSWAAETDWLATELAKPHAPWLMCCAHHNMFGNGSHGDNGVLQTTWGPLFLKYNVAIYLCGHEHTLQHLEIPGWSTSFVIAGGGGADRKPMLRDKRGPFSRASLGFADLQFSPDVVTVSLLDGSANVVHEFTRASDGKVTLLQNSSSDPATKHPLAVINGIDIPGDLAPTTEPSQK